MKDYGHRQHFGNVLAIVYIGIFIVLLITAGQLYADETEQGKATDPNKQTGRCGPFYIWYQTGPDEFSSPSDYVDLYSITFDMSDIVDDFDFVYFTDSKRELDTNEDGVSDQHFAMIDGNLIKWTPINGRARITQQGCWASTFNKHCGYAMISIQPKPWYQNGSARIPVHVKKSCSPNGIDCSETHLVQHTFSGCKVRSLPDFVIRKEVNTDKPLNEGRFVFEYSITVENTTNQPKSTELSDAITSSNQAGEINIEYFNIDCPKNGICQIKTMTKDRFTLELRDIPSNEQVVVTYQMMLDRISIPTGPKTYFTNAATLSSGGSSQVTIGMDGTGEKRPERPRQ